MYDGVGFVVCDCIEVCWWNGYVLWDVVYEFWCGGFFLVVEELVNFGW